jgi:hypothetical protein
MQLTGDGLLPRVLQGSHVPRLMEPRVSESVEALFGSEATIWPLTTTARFGVMALRNPIVALLEIGPMRTPKADNICQPTDAKDSDHSFYEVAGG